MFFLKFKTAVLQNNRFGKQGIKAYQNTSFSKETVVLRFPAKKNAGCPKAPRNFPLRQDFIPHPPSGCLGTSLPLPQSFHGRTLRSQPKFLGSIGY